MPRRAGEPSALVASAPTSRISSSSSTSAAAQPAVATTSIDLSNSTSSDVDLTGIPAFIPLHPPAPADHNPPPTDKLGRMLQNALDARSPEQNALVEKKVRVLTGIFAACVIILPIIAGLFHSSRPPRATLSAETTSPFLLGAPSLCKRVSASLSSQVGILRPHHVRPIDITHKVDVKLLPITALYSLGYLLFLQWCSKRSSRTHALALPTSSQSMLVPGSTLGNNFG